MDQIYEPILEDTVNVKQFFDEYIQKLTHGPHNVDYNDKNELAAELNYDGQIEELEMSVHLENCLLNENDVQVYSFDETLKDMNLKKEVTIPKEAVSLKTIQERIEFLKDKPERKVYTDTPNFLSPKSAMEPPETDSVMTPFSDVLLTVSFFKPYKYEYSSKNHIFDAEFVVRGQQRLSELRDAIKCACDTSGPFVDISKTPTINPRDADPYKDSNSGFFFIANTFYNDFRNPLNQDLSEGIIKWAKKYSTFGTLHKSVMEDTKFIDLENVRLGYPCLYKHYGDCEHLFVIGDIKLLSPWDSLYESDYPYLRRIPRARAKYCDVCSILISQFVVTNSNAHIFDPVQLCEKCFISYHYVDGQKVGSFNAYKITE